MKLKFLVLYFLFLLSINELSAQFSGQNLMEYQYGQLPEEEGTSFSSVYDRALLNYTFKGFSAGATLEQFYTPYNSRNYIRINQARLSYYSKFIEIKAGNYYETLGRGILMRSYEIPGAILEDKSYRSRHYFHRDLLGASAKLRYKNLTAKVLYGKPLNNVLPPTFDINERRVDEIVAVQPDYLLKEQLLGGAVMYLKNSSEKSWFAMANASGSIFPFLSYYAEFARKVSPQVTGDIPSAIYGNMNFTFESFGFSAEYKKYVNFLLGSGINEPPALVKEHSYKVLNRSTHVMQPQNETGYQFEGFVRFQNESVLTLNHTLAINDFGNVYKFREYFAEYAFDIKETSEIKLFADFAQDPFKLEENRRSSGVYSDIKVGLGKSINFSVEFQTFSRDDNSVQNQVYSAGFSGRSKFSAYLISEISNDPNIVEKGSKLWLGTGAKYKLNSNHTLQIFIGERRGGPACNSGVCYEVLDFKGVELRLSSRF